MKLKVLAVFSFAMAASTTVSGQSPSCVPNLDNLTYPAAALTARVQGTVYMTFVVDADGKPEQLVSNTYPLLKEGVEDAAQICANA